MRNMKVLLSTGLVLVVPDTYSAVPNALSAISKNVSSVSENKRMTLNGGSSNSRGGGKQSCLISWRGEISILDLDHQFRKKNYQ